MQATFPQPLQCVCTQVNVSRCKQTRPKSPQHVCTQCNRPYVSKHVSVHVSTSEKQANMSKSLRASAPSETRPYASKQVSGHLCKAGKRVPGHATRLHASRHVPGHISTPARRQAHPQPCQQFLATSACPEAGPYVRLCGTMFFSICFVSLTICLQPRQRVCMQR